MKNEFVIRDEAMTLPVLPKEQRIQLDNVDESFEEGWRQALENLAILPAADVVERPRWIPVTERLPEEWKSVLTYQPYKNDREKPLIRVSWYIGAGIWRECEQANTLELPVTHWMPLPEPPKEET